MNLKRSITDIKGNEMGMSFPSAKDAELHTPETVGNVLINCLAVYPVLSRKEIFIVNHLAAKIMNGDMSDLTEEMKTILSDSLFEATYRKDSEGKPAGVYMPGVIGQVMEELGITS